MAVTRGCFGKVKVGATPSLVAEVRNWTLDQSAEVLDSSSIGDCTKSYTVGAVSWNGNLSCFWDATDTTGQEALDVGTEIDVELYPEGDTTGDVYYSGTAIVSQISRSGGVDGIVEAAFTFQGQGALTQSTVA
jgi:hypothetical protein